MPSPTPSLDQLHGETASLYWWFFVVRVIGSFLVASGITAMRELGVIGFNANPILLGVIPVIVAASAAWWLALRQGWRARFFLYAQIVVDVVIISAGIYYSGGVHSEFVFLYLVPMISAALISRPAVVGIGFAACASYGVLFFSEFSGIVPAVLGPDEAFSADDALRAGVLFIIMVLIGFQSHYYFAQARKKESAIAKIKDEFLFRTVHDLRSPSNAIRWIVEKFSGPEYRGRYPGLEADLGMIQDLNARMLALVRDLGEVVKGEKSAMVLERSIVDLRMVIRGVANELAPAMHGQGIRLVYDPPGIFPSIIGDLKALKEVFTNLMDNAVKYNKPGGTIHIRHEVALDRVLTIVEDSGRGISKENMSKLFTLYFRGDVEKTIPGTGLGLYLVKKLVELMAGSITVASELGQGTSFSVILPKAAK